MARAVDHRDDGEASLVVVRRAARGATAPPVRSAQRAQNGPLPAAVEPIGARRGRARSPRHPRPSRAASAAASTSGTIAPQVARITRSSRDAGLAQAEPARDDVGPHRLLAASSDARCEGLLVDRLGREAEVQRLAVRLLHSVEAVEEEPLELACEARLGVGQPRGLDPDPRVLRATGGRHPRVRARSRTGCRRGRTASPSRCE